MGSVWTAGVEVPEDVQGESPVRSGWRRFASDGLESCLSVSPSHRAERTGAGPPALTGEVGSGRAPQPCLPSSGPPCEPLPKSAAACEQDQQAGRLGRPCFEKLPVSCFDNSAPPASARA